MISAKVKFVTFDRNIIRSNWRLLNKAPLAKSGNLVRKIARNSIRRRTHRTPPNPPGGKPFSRVAGKLPPFKMIYNVPSNFGLTQTIGMVGFGNSSSAPVPGTHEHGLSATKTVNTRFSRLKVKRNSPKLSPKAYKRIYEYYKSKGFIQKKTINYPERPFMRPALKLALPMLPPLWQSALSR